MWDECDQICTNSNNSYSCQCKSNYTLTNGGHCKHITSSFIEFKVNKAVLNYLSKIGDTAKVIFSTGNKIFETNQRAENLRVLYENNNAEINSIDYNFELSAFYMADDKNNKVKQNYSFETTLTKFKFEIKRFIKVITTHQAS